MCERERVGEGESVQERLRACEKEREIARGRERECKRGREDGRV